jgi:hypothetical protein
MERRCQALTLAGTQCKQKIYISGKLCKMHKTRQYEGKLVTFVNKKYIKLCRNISELDSLSSRTKSDNESEYQSGSESGSGSGSGSESYLEYDTDYIEALKHIEQELKNKRKAKLDINNRTVRPIPLLTLASQHRLQNTSQLIGVPESMTGKPVVPTAKPVVTTAKPVVTTAKPTCLTCLESFTEDQIIRCTGTSAKYNHMVCKECLCNYMKIVLNEKKSVGCMFSTTGCCGRYNDYDIMTTLSEDEYMKYLECADVEQAINMAKIFDNYCLCPFCSKFAVTIDNIEGIPDTHLDIKCPRCVKSWCVKCRNEAHVPEPCGRIKVFDKNAICRLIERTIDEQTIHKCPKCFTKYKKEEENGACNLMTCPTCHTYSCYVCGIMVEPKIKPEGTIKYWHFKGHTDADKNAQCVLYYKYGTQKEINEGNKEHNNKKIAEGLERLVTINISNFEIACEIVRQIDIMGIKIKSFPKIDAILYEENRHMIEAERKRIEAELIANRSRKRLEQPKSPKQSKKPRSPSPKVYTKERYERECMEKNIKLLEEEKRNKQCVIM